MREVALVGALPPCPFVPILLAAFSDKSRLFAVLGTVLACEPVGECRHPGRRSCSL